MRTLKEKLLAACEHVEVELRARRNVHAFVNTLPENILRSIFRLAVVLDGNDAIGVAVRISRTCGYWRAIAMKSPAIWTTLKLWTLSGAHATLHITNSQTLPLSVILTEAASHRNGAVSWKTGDPPSCWPYGYGFVRTYCLDETGNYLPRLPFCKAILSRIKSLQIDLMTDDIPQWFLSHEAPIMRFVQIKKKSRPACLLADLFEKGKPELRTVTLQNIFVPWSRLMKANRLTNLFMSFSDRPGPDDNVDQDADILELLRSCSGLQELTLKCRDALRGIPDAPDDPIYLRKLNTLRLDLTLSDMAVVLQSIATPKELRILSLTGRLQVGKRYKKDDSVLKLPSEPHYLPCLGRVLELDVNVPMHGISGSGDGQQAVSLVVKSQTDNLSIAQAMIATTFGRMLEHYPMPQLTQVTIADTSEHRLDPGIIFRFLRASQLLDKLVVKSCSSNLLKKLSAHWTHCATPLCPRLRYVQFVDMTIQLAIFKDFCASYFQYPDLTLNTTQRSKTLYADSTKEITIRRRAHGTLQEIEIGWSVFVISSDGCHIIDIGSASENEVEDEDENENDDEENAGSAAGSGTST